MNYGFRYQLHASIEIHCDRMILTGDPLISIYSLGSLFFSHYKWNGFQKVQEYFHKKIEYFKRQNFFMCIITHIYSNGQPTNSMNRLYHSFRKTIHFSHSFYCLHANIWNFTVFTSENLFFIYANLHSFRSISNWSYSFVIVANFSIRLLVQFGAPFSSWIHTPTEHKNEN